MTRIGLVLLAAGSGTRLGRGIPKALVSVNGTSILEHALAVVPALNPSVTVVTAPADDVDTVRGIVDAAGVSAMVVVGGDTRTASVRAGVAALSEVEVVLIHDVARAWMPVDVFRAVAAEVAATGDGVIPILPMADTVVVVKDAVLTETTDRDSLARVQTPQGFPFDAYRAALSRVDGDFTDDANLWRASGGTVRTVPGDERGQKITVEADLVRAEGGIRVGLGTDTHAFGGDKPLWLGCVEWPGEVGLDGHSDGDAVAHAITDALLQGAGLGDIGSRFGTDDPRYSGARGEVFIRGALEALAGVGRAPRSVSVQIVGNKPKIGPRRGELESVLTAIVGAPVSVSATTTDGLGFTGEGKGITAVAVAHVAVV
ncbi:MAG: hypothetical protein RLZ72_354 [Actinomycetota bacterium]